MVYSASFGFKDFYKTSVIKILKLLWAEYSQFRVVLSAVLHALAIYLIQRQLDITGKVCLS